MQASALLAVALAGLAPAAVAGVYTCIDDQGRIVFRDAACLRGERAAPAQPGARPPGEARRERATDGAATLARKQVTRILDRLDRAMTQRNAKAVTALLAKDARVHWQVQGDASVKGAMDRADYSNYLRKVFARDEYSYRPEPARVSMSKRASRATATRTLRETVLVDGQLHVAQVREKVTVEADGEQLVVLALRREAKIERRL